MDIISCLIKAGADKTIKNKDHQTPYDFAVASHASTEILDLLRI
jgi:ankyrin repeat protein